MSTFFPQPVAAGFQPAVEGGILPPGNEHLCSPWSSVNPKTRFHSQTVPPGGKPGSTAARMAASALALLLLCGAAQAQTYSLGWGYAASGGGQGATNNFTESGVLGLAGVSSWTSPLLYFNTQPQNTTTPLGTTVSFTVSVTGAPTISYQWRRNGLNLTNDASISGATNATLTWSNVQLVATGSFDVVVSNADGAITSSVATLIVIAAPTITTQPVSQSISAGQSATLSVVAAYGEEPKSYQWFKDGVRLLNQTNNTLTFASFQFTQAGSYSVMVSNAYGLALSRPALVGLPNAPLKAWGDNGYGQLGNGTFDNTNRPMTVASNAVAVAAGLEQSLFVRTDGTLWAMGGNGYGQLGNETTLSTNQPVGVASNVVAVTAGGWHSLFAEADGTLWAMGRNLEGQLGNGTTNNASLPVAVASNAVAVAAGGWHSLFVKADGTLWAMGDNSAGQLGNGTTVDTNRPVSVASNVVAVAAGAGHSLFVKADGTLWAMGHNLYGQLGKGTTVSTNWPVSVASNVVAVAAGNVHSLFVKADGTLWAMGYNSSGQLGNGTTVDTNRPVSVASNAAAVAAGYSHSLFVKADGTLWAMGRNFEGQLGNGTTTVNTKLPVQISGLITASLGASGRANHSLAVAAMLPQFTGPTNQIVPSGQPAALSVTVTNGDGPFSFQWLFNNSAVTDATNSSLAFASASLTNAGNYQVIVASPYGSVTSAVAVLTVLPPYSAPVVYIGNGDTGFGGAVGQGTLSLSDNGTTISGTLTKGPGPFNDALVLYIDSVSGGFADTAGFADNYDNMRRTIAGYYHDGTTGFRSALTNQSGFRPDYAVSLAPVAGNFGGLWGLADGGDLSLNYSNSVNLLPLATANSATYTFSFDVRDIGLTPNSGATFKLLGTYLSGTGYRSTEAIAGNVSGVQGWNPFNTTAYATYTIQGPAGIVTDPQSTNVVIASNVTFSVTASGYPLNFQWLFNGAPQLDATNATFTLTNVGFPQQGGYSVVVSNIGNVVTSAVATLTLLLPPSITQQPQSAFAQCGSGSATFSVTPDGTIPLSYQWRLNGDPIAGATSSNYTVNPTTVASAGDYTVLVTNLYGAVTSSIATLTLTNQIPTVANPDAFSMFRNLALTIPAGFVLSNDVAGLCNGLNSNLTVISVSAASSNGGSVILQPGGTALWTNRYSRAVNNNNYARALAVDGSGNVFVTGQSSGSDGSWDYATVAYSSTGGPLWTNHYSRAVNNNDYPWALAVDGSGNVFVTGVSAGSDGYYDYATVAYSGAGVPLWTNRYSRAVNNYDHASALAVDGSGNVFVTGQSSGSDGSWDYATIAYSGAGVPLWTNRYSRDVNSDDSAYALAVDGSGNVFVTGQSSGSDGSWDYATVAYSGAGVPLWTNRYSRAVTNNDHASALAVDGSGNVFVTGSSAGSDGPYDYATVAYSSAGVSLWTNRYSRAVNSYDNAGPLAVDGSGNVFVTGSSEGSDYFSDYATVAYSGAGVPLWTNRYSRVVNNNDNASALAVDGSGNVFVTGYSYGSDSSWDYATVAYSGAGVPLWTNRYSRAVNNYDEARALAVDGSGNVFVTGYSGSSDGYQDYATVKYAGSDQVFYTPPTNFIGTDSFTYVVQDSLGLTATGTVSVVVNPVPPPALSQSPAVVNGNFTAHFSGVPNAAYVIQVLTDFTTGWQFFANVTASPTGEIIFSTPITAAPMRFFRAVPAP